MLQNFKYFAAACNNVVISLSKRYPSHLRSEDVTFSKKNCALLGLVHEIERKLL